MFFFSSTEHTSQIKPLRLSQNKQQHLTGFWKCILQCRSRKAFGSARRGFITVLCNPVFRAGDTAAQDSERGQHCLFLGFQGSSSVAFYAFYFAALKVLIFRLYSVFSLHLGTQNSQSLEARWEYSSLRTGDPKLVGELGNVAGSANKLL